MSRELFNTGGKRLYLTEDHRQHFQHRCRASEIRHPVWAGDHVRVAEEKKARRVPRRASEDLLK